MGISLNQGLKIPDNRTKFRNVLQLLENKKTRELNKNCLDFFLFIKLNHANVPLERRTSWKGGPIAEFSCSFCTSRKPNDVHFKPTYFIFMHLATLHNNMKVISSTQAELDTISESTKQRQQQQRTHARVKQACPRQPCGKQILNRAYQLILSRINVHV